MTKKRPPLYVSLHDVVVAKLTSPGPGKVTCEYTTEALDAHELNRPLVSCSLLLSRRPEKDAGFYFRGILPEGSALTAAAAGAGVPTHDTFGILARYGKDVAGACVISANPTPTASGNVVPYEGDALAADVAGLETRPLALRDDSELSLAGLQNKLLLVETSQGWGRPAHGYPSTHILKVEDRRFPGLVSLEADALVLAKELGLTTVDAHVVTFDRIDCIIVSRFDRTPDGERVHQEDLCQASGTNINEADRMGKYEEFGGPGFADAARLMSLYSVDRDAQWDRLLRVAAFTFVIGNGDAHGKNLAFLHPTPGTIELAPLYDTVPTALWPELKDRAAMAVNGQRTLSAVTRDDLVAEAIGWGMATEDATDVLDQFLDETANAILKLATVLNERLTTLVDNRVRSLQH